MATRRGAIIPPGAPLRGRAAPAAAPRKADFGPTIRLRAKSAPPAPPGQPLTPLQQRQAAAAAVQVDPRRMVVKEFRPDPKSGGLVRGARVRDPLSKMFESGFIGKAEWDAAEAFRDDVALAEGARLDRPEESGVRTAPGGGNWPTDTQRDALRRVTDSLARLGLQQRRLVTWMLLENRSLRSFARELRMRDETASKMLHQVLTFLATRHGGRDGA